MPRPNAADNPCLRHPVFQTAGKKENKCLALRLCSTAVRAVKWLTAEAEGDVEAEEPSAGLRRMGAAYLKPADLGPTGTWQALITASSCFEL